MKDAVDAIPSGGLPSSCIFSNNSISFYFYYGVLSKIDMI